jgi:hypothetical protein
LRGTPSPEARGGPLRGDDMGVMTENPPREREVLCAMAKAKKPESIYEQLSPADQRDVAKFLAGIHARLQLWRMCRNQVCRRRRRCCGDIDACAARCAPPALEMDALLRAGGP